MGISPTRCSSIVHNSTNTVGSCCRASWKRTGSSCLKALLGCRVATRVLRPRPLRSHVHAPQILPPPLRVDLAPQPLLHPGSHLAPAPDATFIRRLLHGCGERFPQRRIQQSGGTGVVVPPVTHRCGAFLVVAPGERSYPW